MAPLTLTEDQALRLAGDEDKFRQFIRINNMSISKHAFVSCVVPVGLTGMRLPFRPIKANSGAANADIVSAIMHTSQVLPDLGFASRLVSFDRDR
jgi:hypothetical protein